MSQAAKARESDVATIIITCSPIIGQMDFTVLIYQRPQTVVNHRQRWLSQGGLLGFQVHGISSLLLVSLLSSLTAQSNPRWRLKQVMDLIFLKVYLPRCISQIVKLIRRHTFGFSQLYQYSIKKKRWRELVKWSPNGKCFDLLANSLN